MVARSTIPYSASVSHRASKRSVSKGASTIFYSPHLTPQTNTSLHDSRNRQSHRNYTPPIPTATAYSATMADQSDHQMGGVEENTAAADKGKGKAPQQAVEETADDDSSDDSGVEEAEVCFPHI